jgi:hypothetical protein
LNSLLFNLTREYFLFKVKEFKNGMIGWADRNVKGRRVKWPCMIERIGRDKRDKGWCTTVRYFDSSAPATTSNNVQPSGVEIFFRTPYHLDFKVCFALDLKL